MTNKTNANRNWVAVEELYERHCREQGISDGIWRYRHVFVVLSALAVGAVAWMVAPHFADPSLSPFTYALIAVLIAWAAKTGVGEHLFTKHQRHVLHRAGIAIPPRAETPSVRALIRNRRQIKLAYQAFCISHRRPGYRHMQRLRYVAALFAPLIFIGAHSLELLPPARTLAEMVGFGVITGVFTCFYVELLVLLLGWARVNNHVPCPDCAGTPLGATSTAFSNENKEEDPEYLPQP